MALFGVFIVENFIVVRVWLLVHLPSLLGRQFPQGLLAFTQAHPLQEPVLLHLQHGIDSSQRSKRSKFAPGCELAVEVVHTAGFSHALKPDQPPAQRQL